MNTASYALGRTQRLRLPATQPTRWQRAKDTGRKVAEMASRHLRLSVKPVAVQIASIPFTIAGAACIDIGVFSASVVAGWITTGVSLIVIEHLVAEE